MHNSLQKLNLVKNKVKEIIEQKQLKTNPNIIIISKTFQLDKLMNLIEYGHNHFGENKIQEAENKWSAIRKKYANLQLHMVGKLQSNKVKKALKIFDYIHSLDNEKLALKISNHEKELKKKIKLFIQVNLADEKQKSGISINNIIDFYNYCTNELSLNVIGLMCLPPFDDDSVKYFQTLQNLSKKLQLLDLSMGMSSDYEKAVMYGSTYLRLGTAILGERKNII